MEPQRKSGPRRPPAVTSASLFIGLSSGLLLLYVLGWLTSWQSLEMQEVHRDVADAVGSSVATVADTLRYVLYVMVVLLVSGVVGAIYAAKGDRGSRVLVTVVAGATALAFIVSGGLLGLLPAAFAFAAIVQLWGRDARRWFAVVNGLPVPPSLVETPTPQAAGTPPLSAQPVGGQPSPGPGTGRPVPAANRRPRPVGTAILITAISSSMALGGALLYLLVYWLVPRDELLRAQLDSPMMDVVEMTEAEIREAMTTSAVFSGIAVVLSVAALIAVWSFSRRRAGGRAVLVVCAGVTVIVGVVSIIGIPWAASAVWVLVLLRRRETRAWLDG